MATVHISKTVVMCLGVCSAAIGLTGIQLSGHDDFAWTGAFEDFPEWLQTAPNPWLLLTTTISAAFAVLGAWAAVVQLQTRPAVTHKEMAEEAEKVACLVTKVAETSEKHHVTLFNAISSERLGYTPDDIRQGRIADNVRAEFIDALVQFAMQNRQVTDQQATEFALVAAKLAQSDIPYHRAAAAMILEGNPEGAADYLINQSSLRAGASYRHAVRPIRMPSAALLAGGGLFWLRYATREAADAAQIYRIVKPAQADMIEDLQTWLGYKA